MKKLNTEQIRDLIARRHVGPVPDAGSFWSDFKARAQLMNQDQQVAEPMFFFSVKRWMLATACAALLALLGGLFLSRSPGGASPESDMTLNVIAGHSAVLMIEDEPSQSTIVWIVDMKAGDDDGESV